MLSRLDPVELNSGVLLNNDIKLPALQAQFHIPQLAQRPQDPIIDYLPSPKKPPTLPVELVALTQTLASGNDAYREIDDKGLWARALEHSGAMPVSARSFIMGNKSSLLCLEPVAYLGCTPSYNAQAGVL
jgi:hypothetical protein